MSHRPADVHPLEPGTVTLQSGTLHAEPAELRALAALLTPDETARAERFRHDRHRRRFIVAHGRLRQILGTAVGTPPEALRFRYGKHGKPRLEGGPSFNLSHSGDRYLIALSPRGRLGVDVEAERPLRDMERLARKKFSSDELEALMRAPPSARLSAFFRIWTLKEAYLKAIGTGLATRLSSFSVDPDAGHAHALIRIDDSGESPGQWLVRRLSQDQGFAAAVAIDEPGVTIRRVTARV